MKWFRWLFPKCWRCRDRFVIVDRKGGGGMCDCPAAIAQRKKWMQEANAEIEAALAKAMQAQREKL